MNVFRLVGFWRNTNVFQDEISNSVKAIAALNTEASNAVFNNFGANMGIFFFPWLDKFGCEELVIGGNISKARALFMPALKEKLNTD